MATKWPACPEIFLYSLANFGHQMLKVAIAGLWISVYIYICGDSKWLETWVMILQASNSWTLWGT